MIPSVYNGKYSSGKFSRGYKGGRLSTSIDSRPPSEAYRSGCEFMGWDKMQQFCTACGRLPSWCECKQAEQKDSNG